MLEKKVSGSILGDWTSSSEWPALQRLYSNRRPAEGPGREDQALQFRIDSSGYRTKGQRLVDVVIPSDYQFGECWRDFSFQNIVIRN